MCQLGCWVDLSQAEVHLLFAPGSSLPQNSVSSALIMSLQFFFYISGSWIKPEAKIEQCIDLKYLGWDLPVFNRRDLCGMCGWEWRSQPTWVTSLGVRIVVMGREAAERQWGHF